MITLTTGILKKRTEIGPRHGQKLWLNDSQGFISTTFMCRGKTQSDKEKPEQEVTTCNKYTDT